MTLLARAGPAALLSGANLRIGSEFVAKSAPEVREKIYATGLLPIGGSPADFDAHIKREMERWSKVIKARGIKAG